MPALWVNRAGGGSVLKTAKDANAAKAAWIGKVGSLRGWTGQAHSMELVLVLVVVMTFLVIVCVLAMRDMLRQPPPDNDQP